MMESVNSTMIYCKNFCECNNKKKSKKKERKEHTYIPMKTHIKCTNDW
jgi:hypothetical protein